MRMKTIAIIACCLVLVLLICSVQPVSLHASDQLVRVEERVDQNGTVAGGDQQNTRQVLARGVLQEALELLPGELSAARKRVLFSLLLPRAKTYVLSYSRGKAEISGERRTTSWRVAVNKEMLRDSLKEWGVYFTVGQQWFYSLKLQSPVPQKDRQRIQSLETLSGLASTAGAGFPRLLLVRGAGQDTVWKGKLELEDRAWTRRGAGLEEVWLGLWADYFSLPRVQARVLTRTTLIVKGWSSISGVQGFDRLLQEHSALVDQAALVSIDLGMTSVQGTWKVQTPDRAALEDFCNKYLPPRLLEYRFTTGETGENE